MTLKVSVATCMSTTSLYFYLQNNDLAAHLEESDRTVYLSSCQLLLVSVHVRKQIPSVPKSFWQMGTVHVQYSMLL